MGKGTIISDLGDGQYSLQVNYDQTTQQTELTLLNSTITRLDTAISDKEQEIIDNPEKARRLIHDLNFMKFQRLSCERRIEYIGKYNKTDSTIAVWCADLTTGLSGEVGTIEIPGESINFNIVPGFDSAVYDVALHGQLVPLVGMSAAQVYYNLAMLPGWQKWKPIFRYGTITSLTDDVADITLDVAESTQQDLDVNQAGTLSGVDIEYMDCNGIAFEVGNAVLIKFEGQDFSTPKVVGFKDTPQPCGPPEFAYITLQIINGVNSPVDPYCIVWSLQKRGLATTIPKNAAVGGGFASFPILASDISDWYDLQTDLSQDAITKSSHLTQGHTEPNDWTSRLNDWIFSDPNTVTNPSANCVHEVNYVDHPDTIPGGFDYLGNSGQDGDYDVSLFTRQWFNAQGGEELTWEGSRPYGAPYVLEQRMVSKTNIGGTRSRNPSCDILINSWMADYTDFSLVTACLEIDSPGLGASESVLETYSIEQIQYESVSPFSDKTVYNFEISREEYSLDISNESCENYIDLLDISSVQFKAEGVMSDNYMVCFYAEEISSSFITIPCANSTIWGFIECDATSSPPYRACQTAWSTPVYGTLVPFFTKGMIGQKAPSDIDTQNLNPFAIPENSAFSTALESLKDTVQGVTGDPPTLQHPPNLLFGAKILG